LINRLSKRNNTIILFLIHKKNYFDGEKAILFSKDEKTPLSLIIKYFLYYNITIIGTDEVLVIPLIKNWITII